MTIDFIRVALAGSRSAWTRLGGMVAGIALGTALLLVLIGAFNGLGARDDRMAWGNVSGEAASATSLPDRDSVLVSKVADWFDGQPILRLDVATAPGSQVTLPGIATPLAPGHFRASPALLALIKQQPQDELAARYGIADGEIGPEALVGPDTLAIIQAVTPEALAGRRGVVMASNLAGTPSGESVGYQIIVAIGATGIFFPVLLLIAIVTQLGASARIEAFSTLRLIGATPRQLALVTGIENMAVSVAGALLGAALSLVLVPLAGQFPVNGSRFYLHDLAVTPGTVAIAVAAMMVVSAIATAIGMGRSRISPLGASRQILERPPGWWRLVPLLVGLGAMGLAWLSSSTLPLLSGLAMALALLVGFVVVSVGIVVVGPWLTHHASLVMARHARTAAGAIAGNRIACLPKATFRAVSGLIIAVFMVTVFCAASSGTVRQMQVWDSADRLPVGALFMRLKGAPPQISDDEVVLYGGPGLDEDLVAVRTADAAALGLAVSADQGLVTFHLGAYLDPTLARSAQVSVRTDLDADDLAPVAVVVPTDGSSLALERTRTALQAGRGWAAAPVTRGEAAMIGTQRIIAELAMIAYAGALLSIAIAGCSLAIATAGAMIDRKRVLGLLRLMGMPLQQLYAVVIFEAAVPLVAVLGLSVGLGFVVAWLIVESISPSLDIAVPEPLYFVTLGLGLVLALGAVAATLRMVRANTALSATRFE